MRHGAGKAVLEITLSHTVKVQTAGMFKGCLKLGMVVHSRVQGQSGLHRFCFLVFFFVPFFVPNNLPCKQVNL